MTEQSKAIIGICTIVVAFSGAFLLDTALDTPLKAAQRFQHQQERAIAACTLGGGVAETTGRGHEFKVSWGFGNEAWVETTALKWCSVSLLPPRVSSVTGLGGQWILDAAEGGASGNDRWTYQQYSFAGTPAQGQLWCVYGALADDAGQASGAITVEAPKP